MEAYALLLAALTLIGDASGDLYGRRKDRARFVAMGTFVVLRLAFSQADPPTVIVDHDADVIQVQYCQIGLLEISPALLIAGRVASVHHASSGFGGSGASLPAGLPITYPRTDTIGLQRSGPKRGLSIPNIYAGPVSILVSAPNEAPSLLPGASCWILRRPMPPRRGGRVITASDI